MMLALTTLALTIIVETVVACLLLPRERKRLRVDVPLINLTTHPLATLAIGSLGAPFALIELLVIAVEFVAYRVVTGLDPARAALLAIVTNGITIFLSFALAGVF